MYAYLMRAKCLLAFNFYLKLIFSLFFFLFFIIYAAFFARPTANAAKVSSKSNYIYKHNMCKENRAAQ